MTVDPRADQIQAAADDARRLVLDDAARYRRLVVNRPTGTTYTLLARYIESIQGPPVLVCDHAEHGPTPVVGFAAAPAAIFCRPCAEYAATDMPTRACDACEADDVPTIGASAVHGVLELRIRLCKHCAAPEVHPCQS